MAYKIAKFDSKNIFRIVDVVRPLWTVPAMRDSFARIYAECIVRMNFCENEFALQLEDNGDFKAMTFAEKKGESSAAKGWIDDQVRSGGLTDEEVASLRLCQKYILQMDERTFSYMNDDDVKLSLFVSTEKGFGSPLLKELQGRFVSHGFKNMYLWTDCDCDWEYYQRHGFELVEEGQYNEFSHDGEPYRTFIFRKRFGW